MRLIAIFTFAYLTELQGFMLFAPYAVFALTVLHMVHKRRRGQSMTPAVDLAENVAPQRLNVVSASVGQNQFSM